MFHFPASPPAPYELRTRVTPHHGRRVPPFGNPRITARKPAPRGISQATASFIGPRCQGIHRTLITTNHNKHTTTNTRHPAPRPPPPPPHQGGRPNRRAHDRGAQGAPHPKNNKGTGRPANPTKKQRRQRPDGTDPPKRPAPQTDIIAMMLASTMQFTTNPPTTRPHPPQGGPGSGPGPTRAHRPRTRQHATPRIRDQNRTP